MVFAISSLRRDTLMKRKHVIAALFVSLATSFGALAGTISHKQSKAVKAESPAAYYNVTFFVAFDARSIDSSWRSECSNFRIHFWGTVSKWDDTPFEKTFSLCETGYSDFYASTIAFNCDVAYITGYEFIFDQNYQEKKSMVFNDNTSYARASNAYSYLYGLDGNAQWQDGKWPCNLTSSSSTITLTSGVNTYSFDPKPQFERFSLAINVTNSNSNDEFVLHMFDTSFQSANDFAYSMFLNKDLITPGATRNSFKFNQTGNFDLHINNYCKSTQIDGVDQKGIIDLKPNNGYHDGYIYYVSQDSREDGHIKLYTFLESCTTGEWAGIDLNSVSGVEIVDVVNGFRFENNSYKVYKIPVQFGPYADSQFILSYTGDAYGQTADLPIADHAAYWRGSAKGSFNSDAGKALDLFYDLQTVLSIVDSYSYKGHSLSNSVCAVSSSEAARLYLAYTSLSSFVRTKYIDASYVNTHNADGTGLNYISAYDIFQELGRIGGVVGSSRINLLSETSLNDASTVATIIVVAIISAGSVGVFFTLKKRKHN